MPQVSHLKGLRKKIKACFIRLLQLNSFRHQQQKKIWLTYFRSAFFRGPACYPLSWSSCRNSGSRRRGAHWSGFAYEFLSFTSHQIPQNSRETYIRRVMCLYASVGGRLDEIYGKKSSGNLRIGTLISAFSIFCIVK